MIKNLTDYLFYSNEYCKFCLDEKSNSNICKTCIERLEFIKSKRELKYGICYYPLFYNNYIRYLIKKFKYEKCTYLAKPFAEIIYKFYLSIDEDFDYISYVPMYPKDEFDRGYNQAELLAREFSKLSGIDLIEIAKKNKKTKHQNKIDRNERYQNLMSSIEIIRDLEIENKKILIIDDLVTTGSTLNILAKEIVESYNVKLGFMAIASSKIDSEEIDD